MRLEAEWGVNDILIDRLFWRASADLTILPPLCVIHHERRIMRR